MPRRMLVRCVVVFGLVAGVLAMSYTASAAPAPNDNFANRATVGLGDVTVDLTDATEEPFDAQVFDQCSSPNAGQTVWYELDVPTTPAGAVVEVDIANDSFGRLEWQVVTGQPGAFTGLVCGTTGFGPRRAFQPEAGEHYYLIAYDWRGLGGGTATIRLSNPLSFTIDGASLNSDGGVSVSGTYTCSTRPLQFFLWSLRLTQQVGRGSVATFGQGTLEPVTCNGTPQPWAFSTADSFGRLSGGPAVLGLTVNYCTGFPCPGLVLTPTTIVLNGQPGPNPGPPADPVADAIDLTGKPSEAAVVDTPALRITLASRATVDADGAVTLSGSYRCAPTSGAIGVGVVFSAVQPVGRGFATGSGGNELAPTCDGQAHSWAFTGFRDDPDTLIRGGKLFVSVLAYAYNDIFDFIAFEAKDYLVHVTPKNQPKS